MPIIVPFYIKCTACAGTGEINRDDYSTGPSCGDFKETCWQCQGSSQLASGHIRLDTLRTFHKREEAAKIPCNKCNGSGKRPDNPRKKCRACKGLRINPFDVVIRIKGKQITLEDYLDPDD